MTERFALAAIILLAIVLVGVVVRFWSRWRCSRLAAMLVTGRSADDLPQILSFYGPSCTACERQKRIITELRDARPDALTVQFIDAASDVNLALRYGVVVVPTTIVASASGGIVAITSGLISSERLAGQLAQAV